MSGGFRERERERGGERGEKKGSRFYEIINVIFYSRVHISL